MVATLSPASESLSESLSTLRFAHRAKAISNIPVVNISGEKAALAQCREEILRLKRLLAQAGKAPTRKKPSHKL